MDLNYDQFNGDALIFKYNLDEYGNPISIKVDKEEKQISVHGTIQLEYVPDEYNRVVMLNEDNTQMTEVFNRDEIKPNTYYIDYNNGVAYLDKSQFGKTKIYNYYNKGLQLIGCSRIYDEHDVSGKHVVLTLQEIIDAGREALRFLLDIGDAKKVIEKLETLIAEGKVTVTNIKNAITKAEADKNEIVQEIQDNIQQAKDEVINVRGNKEVLIQSSQWTLNGDVYEKEITHELNSENLHVTAKNSNTKEVVTIGYKILDKSRILLKSDEAINMSVILSASYYHATQTISDDIAEEVVKARGGQAQLKDRLDNFDEHLEHKMNKNDELTMANMGQDVREAMTGGSVAVVGEKCVGTENLKDRSVDNTILKYTGHMRECGSLYPFEVIMRNQTIQDETNEFVRCVILDIHIYNVKKEKIYKIEWVGNNTTIGDEAYWGIELNEYNEDFTGKRLLIPYWHEVNKIAPTNDVEQRIYELDDITVVVKYNWRNPQSQIQMRNGGTIVDRLNYLPYLHEKNANEKYISQMELDGTNLITKNSLGNVKDTISLPKIPMGSILNNKGVDYPLKKMARKGINHDIPLPMKNAILDLKIFGANPTKYYKLQYVSCGYNLNGGTFWSVEIDEFNRNDYADTDHQYVPTPSRILTYYMFDEQTPKNGIMTNEYRSKNNEEIVVRMTIDWDCLEVGRQYNYRSHTWIIDESCYDYCITQKQIISEAVQVYPMYVKKQSSKSVRIAWKYNKENDMWFHIAPCGCSNLPQIHNIHLVANANKHPNPNLTSDSTLWFKCPSDFVGPYAGLVAINNGDGDKPDSGDWIGGWHGYNNDLTGAPTAQNLKFEVYVNNTLLESIDEIIGAYSIKVVVTNGLYGSNTKKQDGTGRIIAEEQVVYEFNQGKINISHKFKALEELRIGTYYGIQTCNYNWNDYCLPINDPIIKVPFDPKGVQKLGGSKNDGSKVCEYHLSKEGHNLRAFIDPTYGLGLRENVPNTKFLFHTQSYGKSYFMLIDGGKTMTTGEEMHWRGGYEFYFLEQ